MRSATETRRPHPVDTRLMAHARGRCLLSVQECWSSGLGWSQSGRSTLGWAGGDASRWGAGGPLGRLQPEPSCPSLPPPPLLPPLSWSSHQKEPEAKLRAQKSGGALSHFELRLHLTAPSSRGRPPPPHLLCLPVTLVEGYWESRGAPESLGRVGYPPTGWREIRLVGAHPWGQRQSLGRGHRGNVVWGPPSSPHLAACGRSDPRMLA